MRTIQGLTICCLLLSAASAGAGHQLLRRTPERPQISPACSPIWGYHRTCWQRFPMMPPCDSGDDCLSGSISDFDPGIATNAERESRPISVLPNQGQAATPAAPSLTPANVPLAPYGNQQGLPSTSLPLPPLPSGLQPRPESSAVPNLPAATGGQSQSRYGVPLPQPLRTLSPTNYSSPASNYLPPVAGSGRYGR